MLGELITRVTSEQWDDAVRERITEPLGMRSTGVVGFDAAPGFIAADGTLVPFDSASVHPSVGGAAGGMQSTASDLLVFIEALVDGRLLSDRIQAEMETFTPGEDYSQFGVVHGYGLGFESYSTDQVTALGHMGTGAAHGAFAGFDPETGTAVVTLMNSDMAARRRSWPSRRWWPRRADRRMSDSRPGSSDPGLYGVTAAVPRWCRISDHFGGSSDPRP